MRLRPICETSPSATFGWKIRGERAKECGDRHAGQTNACGGAEQCEKSDLSERKVARHRSEPEREQHERGDGKRRDRSAGGAREQKQQAEEREGEQLPTTVRAAVA